jgi:hypothetical protein
MKTKITLLSMMLMISTFINAQDSTRTSLQNSGKLKSADRVFGMGWRSSNLLSDASLFISEDITVIPGNRIVFTIDPHPNFRIQPEFGYFHSSHKSETLSEDIGGSNLVFALGAYGKWKIERTNLYGGLKYTTGKITYDDVQSSYNPNPPYNYTYSKVTKVITNNGLGIVFGGEYLLSNHFSVGTEIGVHSIKTKSKYESSSDDPFESNSFLTETNLMLRFYF